MLFAFCLLQIAVYLFLAPVLRAEFGADRTLSEYYFFLSLLFLASFLIGALAQRRLLKPKPLTSAYNLSLTDRGGLVFIAWSAIYIFVAVENSLYNRRIGTESAAELFASINPGVLITFRVFEVLMPVWLVAAISKAHSAKRFSSVDSLCLVMLVIAIACSGIAYSRSQLFLFLMTTVVMAQHLVPRRALRKVLILSALGGGLVFALVSMSRWSSEEVIDPQRYLEREVLTRVDGLEIVSDLYSWYGPTMFGVDSTAALNPLISSIPFLPGAQELKVDALTTVKSMILDSEYHSSARDVNAFVVLDAFYWGGLSAVALTGVLLGFFARLVDAKIGRYSSALTQAFLFAVAANIIIMERESLSMALGIARDFVIYACALLFMFGKHAADGHRRMPTAPAI